MASAGTVTVDFAAETAKFTAELKKVRGDLAILKKDSASVNATLASFGNSVKGLIGFAAAATAIRAVVRATAEAEQAQALLNNALAAAGANVKAASADFQAYATQLQRSTTFGDEAIIQVESLLLAFQGLSGETVKRATATVLDLSTRMGIDAPAAAKLLGKALADPEKGMTALTRAGVIFSDAQKAQIKALKDAGDAAGAQGLILAELEQRFGGAASAARDTFGGAIAGLNNAFDDLLEGKSGFAAATEGINALTDTLSDPAVVAGIGQIIGGLAKVIELASKAAAGLAILFTGEGGNESVDIDNKIESLRQQQLMWMGESEEAVRKRAEYESAIKQLLITQREILDLGQETSLGPSNVGGPKGRRGGTPAVAATDFVTGGTPTDDVESETKAEMERRQKAAVDLATAEYEGRQAVEALITDLHQREIEKRLAREEAFLDASADLTLKNGDRLDAENSLALENEEKAAEARLDVEARTQQQLQQFRANGFAAAQSLLTAYDGKFRAVAKAALLYEKANAIASAIMSTKQAVMATYARLGYPWGIPAATAVAALGAVQVAAIAGTNPGGGSAGGSVSGGGASIGTPNNSVFSDTGAGAAQQGVSSQRVLQVIFNGPVYQTDDFRQHVIDAIREEVDEREVIIISPTSRQAAELREP